MTWGTVITVGVGHSARREPGVRFGHEPESALERARRLAREGADKPDARAVNENRLCRTVAFLTGSAYPRLFLSKASLHAVRNGTHGAAELLAHGLITETAYYRALADHAGVAFVEPGEIAGALAGEDAIDERALRRNAAWCLLGDGSVKALYAPDPGRAGVGTELFRRRVAGTAHVALTTPTGLREALTHHARQPLGRTASDGLATTRPQYSARFGAGPAHGFALAAILAGLVAGVVLSPMMTLFAIHGIVTAFFLAVVTIRLLAAVSWRPREFATLLRYPNAERPVYSVIVALNREAPVVADLVRALKALRWPRAKLEIKLVLEEGDDETRAALARETLDRRFEIVTVPALGPQTKPKALNYALPFCNGSFVTLYDAEDRPHPDQIEEAWQVFRRAGPMLGALQAPLSIANPHRNWLTAQFFLEYAAQFQGLLRFLARHRLPIPLGGTSTHFRRAAIEDCGGWDPHNVTEDADLGFRMWRMGYRIDVLTRPTLEDAPDTLPVWISQRTRWIKGWMQTWIVHSRGIASTPQGSRLAGALVMHVLMAGTVGCALLYPLTIATIAVLSVWTAAIGSVPVVWSAITVLDWASVGLAFAASAALTLRTVGWRHRGLALRALPGLPAYWLLSSWAGWRALRQYFSNRFLWEKTPHRPHDPGGDSHCG